MINAMMDTMGRVLYNPMECLRCGHRWFPGWRTLRRIIRGEMAEVRSCPRCQSPWWDIPRPDDRIVKFKQVAERIEDIEKEEAKDPYHGQ